MINKDESKIFIRKFILFSDCDIHNFYRAQSRCCRFVGCFNAITRTIKVGGEWWFIETIVDCCGLCIVTVLSSLPQNMRPLNVIPCYIPLGVAGQRNLFRVSDAIIACMRVSVLPQVIKLWGLNKIAGMLFYFPYQASIGGHLNSVILLILELIPNCQQ